MRTFQEGETRFTREFGWGAIPGRRPTDRTSGIGLAPAANFSRRFRCYGAGRGVDGSFAGASSLQHRFHWRRERLLHCGGPVYAPILAQLLYLLGSREGWGRKFVHQTLPSAYPGAGQFRPGPGARAGVAAPGRTGEVQADLVAYLQANTQDVEYLVAVPSAQTGAPLVLATGRPVLYMGGFSGQDRAVTAEDLQGMVASGRLRYVLYDGMGGRQDIAAWLQSSCTVVPEFSAFGGEGPGGPADRATRLYRCGG